MGCAALGRTACCCAPLLPRPTTPWCASPSRPPAGRGLRASAVPSPANCGLAGRVPLLQSSSGGGGSRAAPRRRRHERAAAVGGRRRQRQRQRRRARAPRLGWPARLSAADVRGALSLSQPPLLPLHSVPRPTAAKAVQCVYISARPLESAAVSCRPRVLAPLCCCPLMWLWAAARRPPIRLANLPNSPSLLTPSVLCLLCIHVDSSCCSPQRLPARRSVQLSAAAACGVGVAEQPHNCLTTKPLALLIKAMAIHSQPCRTCIHPAD